VFLAEDQQNIISKTSSIVQVEPITNWNNIFIQVKFLWNDYGTIQLL
jgi:hypothetical protein